MREVAVPAEGDERVAGGADEDVEVRGFGGEQAGKRGGGQGGAATTDDDAGGDAEGGVRDVVHAPNLRNSAREGRRTFVFCGLLPPIGWNPGAFFPSNASPP